MSTIASDPRARLEARIRDKEEELSGCRKVYGGTHPETVATEKALARLCRQRAEIDQLELISEPVGRGAP